MNRDDIIRMAREAGLVMYDYSDPSLERFANLVAEHERTKISASVNQIHDWYSRARLAQPEQEPVWVEVTTNTGDKFILSSAEEADKIRAAKNIGLSVVPLYTAPPQREWQRMTENEIKHLWYEACQTNLELTSQLIVHLARNIEAKLKERNT